MGKIGQKFAGRIGRKFGLSGEQVMMVIMVGVPILMKFLASRKRAKMMRKQGQDQNNIIRR